MTQSPKQPKTTSRWGQERRLEFIDVRLRWDGRINRSDLTTFFGISVPQASLDIARYVELAPDNAVYDRSARVYLAGERFKPLYPSNTPQRFLNELLAQAAGVLQPELTFIGWTPSTGLTASPGRQVPAEVLLPLLAAIREGKQVQVSYQSMSSMEPVERHLSPHAIAFDGFRWHVRAHCHRREQYLDFVIARIIEARATDETAVAGDKDEAWHRKVSLLLGPNPALSVAAQRVIELDYGMTNGRVTLDCRQALLFYTLKRLGLLAGQEAPPEAQQIALLNRPEVLPYLPKTSMASD
ncbi:helix-turn-helix transcriptional regulator [Rubrivivax gelatinosus]|nr:WYL domain-containing protein [Rubrivivax gelatinosus]